MKELKYIRQQLGFSQEDLARTLGVKRSMIVRAEECRGDLTTTALLRLLQLKEYINIAGEMEDLQVEDVSSLLQEHESRKQDCRYKIALLQRKLRRLKEMHNANQNGHKVLVLMEMNGDKVPPTWLAVAADKAKSKISKCSPLVLSELERKIAGLQAELQYIENEIFKLKNEQPVASKQDNAAEPTPTSQTEVANSVSYNIISINPDAPEISRFLPQSPRKLQSQSIPARSRGGVQPAKSAANNLSRTFLNGFGEIVQEEKEKQKEKELSNKPEQDLKIRLI